MDEQPKNNAADTNGNAEAPPNTQNGGTTSEQTEGLPSDFNQLYSFLKTTTDKNDLGQYVYIEQTPTRIFIRFNNTIMWQQCGAEGRRQAGTQQVHARYKGGQQVYKILRSIRSYCKGSIRCERLGSVGGKSVKRCKIYGLQPLC